jgi:mutator protein MutT
LVTAAVIIAADKILMAKRLPFGNEAGKWEFPGGKVEPGEDLRFCLKRELKEELGITVEAGKVLDIVSEVKEETQLVLVYFLCQIMSGTPVPLQCQEVGWLYPEEINFLEKPAADERFWKALRAGAYIIIRKKFV